MSAHRRLTNLACGCKALRDESGWRIEAESFMCFDSHKQGDFVSREDANRRREVEAEWARAEDEFLGRM